MENNFAKQTTSSFTQPNYGANYYAPPSVMEISNHNLKTTKDLESFSTQDTADRSPFPGLDLDAQRAERSKRAFQVDQAGMYVPVFPNGGGIREPMLHPNHACTKCYDCQMRIQREIEEKRRKEKQCLEDCNTFCEVCGAVLMLCDIMIQCCALCDAAK